MPSWPSSLSLKAIAGTHQTRPDPNVAAFKPDVGEPIRRRRHTGRSATESFDQVLTKAQFNVLEEFWNHDCAQGTFSFFAPLIDGVVRKWWFDSEQPYNAVNIPGGTAYSVSYNMGCKR